MRNNNNVPMKNLNGGAGAYGQQKQRDPRKILDDCRDINLAIDVTAQKLDTLKRLQAQALNDPDSSSNSQSRRQLDNLATEIKTDYSSYVSRVNKIRTTPGADEPANSSHISITREKLKTAMNKYMEANLAYETNIQDQLKRQFRIVRPDASEEEVEASANANTGESVFATAVWFQNSVATHDLIL